MRKNKAKCEVCFFNQFTGPQNSHVIVCKGCKREAHRFCYLPQCEDKHFQCDACQSKIKNPQCFICHNEGLLKRTHEGQFGHPICLMLSKQSLVKSYQKLSFYYLKNKKKAKLFKCDICGKNSSFNNLTKCFDGHCPSVAHFYCILRQQWKDNQQGNKWVQNLKLFESSYLNSLQYFQNKVKSFIHKFPNAIYKLIFDQKKLVEITPNYVAYCRNHSQCLSNCYCETLDEPNAKVDWVYCDSCGKWYHFQCQSIGVDQSIQQEYYTCKCCQQWRAVIHKKQQPVIIFYPKMHFYDLVYIQNYAENRGYKVTPLMIELIKRVPFLCSIRYFNQVIKDKDIVSKIIKKTNFLPLKTMLVQKVSSKKQLTKILERLSKPLIDTLWKMDFLTCTDPIESIIKNKKGDYKLEQILSILQRYNKRYSTGINLIKPAIKQLSKYHEQKYEHEDSEADEQSNLLQGCIMVLREQLNEMKKINPNNKNNQNILINYYKAINQNQVLKEIVKNYIQQNKVLSELLQPLFIYQLESDMFHHTKFNFVFQKLIANYEKGDKMKNIYKLGEYCQKVYEKCPSKVQIKNKKTMRELMLHNKNQYQVVSEKYIILQSSSIQKVQQKKEDQRNIHNIFETTGIKHSSRDMIELQAYLQNQYKQQLVEFIFKNLDLKSSALNYLYLQYSKMSEIIRNNDQLCYKPYIKTYQASKNLIQAICEGTNLENQLNDVDMLALIKKIKIDRQNINQFCVYFNQICQLSLIKLKSDIPKVVQEKGLQLMNYICQRSMIFQCQLQFKAVSSLMSKFKYKKQEKIQELINRNKQLIDMLRKFSFDSLQSLQFMESNIKILKEAKQYCQQNNLEFRISKIEYALKLFEIKQEAFKYFPAEYIVKNTEKLSRKFTTIDKITSIDYCLLKKFMYKMKLIKFPVTDHLYIKVNDLYTSRTDYFNILSSVITYYNCLTFKESITAQYPKFKKTEVQYLISSTNNSFVTCQPQEQQIFIIFTLYDKVLEKINKILKNDELDIEYCNKVHKQFLKFPFQIEQNSEFKIFCDRLTRFKNKEIKVEVLQTSSCVNVECLSINKKGFQQQTSQKAQFMDKDSKNAYNFIAQIQNRPRNLTIEDIKTRLTQVSDKNIQSNINVYLNKMTEVANAIIQSNSHLIAKLNKGDPLSQFDNGKAKKMIEEYQKQPIRIEIIEKIIRYIRGVDSFLVTNLEESKKATEFQVSKFSNRSLSSQLSRQNGRSSSKSSQKLKKTKIVLRK